MFRALTKYFGVEPDLDIEAQRAIVVLKRPMSVDWRAVNDLIARASYTFGGVHIRARGQIEEVQGADGQGGVLVFRLSGSDYRLGVRESPRSHRLPASEVEIAGRIDEWEADSPLLTILEINDL